MTTWILLGCRPAVIMDELQKTATEVLDDYIFTGKNAPASEEEFKSLLWLERRYQPIEDEL